MQTSNYDCKDCKNNWEFVKNSIKENFPEHPECPNCKSINTTRDFSNGAPATYVAEGKVGNAKNGYKTNIVAHPSPYSKKSNSDTSWE
jgi:hypothetical protein